ncbi:MAG: LLM class flavin-dependent oxidoreductase, partial [Candidatus Bathyarchaeota archaeon]|nr:LLM class flavin-dependent oxidoreductase [Candidatus Bathyarchaeota archaeon]
MAHGKARFGVLLPNLTSTFDLASSAAKVAEKLGFASVWCMDHLICEPEFYRLLNVNSDSFRLLETWT